MRTSPPTPFLSFLPMIDRVCAAKAYPWRNTNSLLTLSECWPMYWYLLVIFLPCVHFLMLNSLDGADASLNYFYYSIKPVQIILFLHLEELYFLFLYEEISSYGTIFCTSLEWVSTYYSVNRFKIDLLTNFALLICINLYNSTQKQTHFASNFRMHYRNPGADPGIYFGGQTKVPNRKLRAKPESRARSARVSRARSAREFRAKPEPKAKPEKKRGEGSGEGAQWAPP